jgi:subtilisin family serine protease
VGARLTPAGYARLANQVAAGEITAITPNAPVRLAESAWKEGDDGEKSEKRKGEDPAPATDYPDVVGADVAWEAGVAGRGVTVAVLDTGISRMPGVTSYANGRNRLAGWVDFVERSKSPRDPNGHGTHIAGIIANTEQGADGEYNGVAPGVRLAGVRVLDKEGFGTYEQVIQGIQWVIENQKKLDIRVINLSLVSSVQSPYWADPLNQAVMRAWKEEITVVVAAGNSGPGAMTISVPGNNPYVITVGAFTDNFTPSDWSDDYLAPFSAAGPTLDGFTKPDILAPGAHMVSTMPGDSYLAKNHSANQVAPDYFSMAGTSQAAAVVSGIAALVISNQPRLEPDEIKFRLMYTSFPWIDLQGENALYSIWQQGAGRVNAPDAVFGEMDGKANQGLDLKTDLKGKQHYQGYSYYDKDSGQFRLQGEFSSWAGGYGAWAGGYGAWAGGYGAWAGGYGAWAGGYGAWAGGYGAWAGGYGAWAGGYGAWAGGYGAWAGGYGAWAGGYGAWAGGYGAWAGSYGDPTFAEKFTNWRDEYGNWEGARPGTGNWIDFGG